MRKHLLAAVAVVGIMGSFSGAQAAVLLGTFEGNDCSGVFGTGATCNTGGTFTTTDGRQVTLASTPLVAKLNPNGSVDQLGTFASVTGSEFSITNTGQGTLNYTYTPGTGDPLLTYAVVKGGNFFNVFSVAASGTDSVFAPTNSNNGNLFGTSHISFYDSFTPPTTVPEPMSLALFGAGLLGLGLVKRWTSQA